MSKPGPRRPERRNRTIGTVSSGFRRRNDLRIPESWADGDERRFYERVDGANWSAAKVGGRDIAIAFASPNPGFSYGCTPQDVLRLLTAVAPLVPKLPDIIAFRQPTRKQRVLNPVWGRFLYSARFGAHCGTAIGLEAQQTGACLRWPKRLRPEDRAELDRLRADGHLFRETRRYYEAVLEPGALRNTILYRTVLHELGHLAHYHDEVLDADSATSPDQSFAAERYFRKPVAERETFAHRFAEVISAQLRSAGAIPFDPMPR